MNRISDEVLDRTTSVEELILLARKGECDVDWVLREVEMFEKEIAKLFPNQTIEQVLYMVDNFEKIKSLFGYSSSSLYFTILEYKTKKETAQKTKTCTNCGRNQGTNQIFGENGAIPRMIYCDKCADTLI